jgi:hypothetical protein
MVALPRHDTLRTHPGTGRDLKRCPDGAYRSGPSRDWIKVKNPDSPAMVRYREEIW